MCVGVGSLGFVEEIGRSSLVARRDWKFESLWEWKCWALWKRLVSQVLFRIGDWKVKCHVEDRLEGGVSVERSVWALWKRLEGRVSFRVEIGR